MKGSHLKNSLLLGYFLTQISVDHCAQFNTLTLLPAPTQLRVSKRQACGLVVEYDHHRPVLVQRWSFLTSKQPSWFHDQPKETKNCPSLYWWTRVHCVCVISSVHPNICMKFCYLGRLLSQYFMSNWKYSPCEPRDVTPSTDWGVKLEIMLLWALQCVVATSPQKAVSAL